MHYLLPINTENNLNVERWLDKTDNNMAELWIIIIWIKHLHPMIILRLVMCCTGNVYFLQNYWNLPIHTFQIMCSLYMKSQNFLSYIPVMKKNPIFSVVCDQYQNKKLNIEKKDCWKVNIYHCCIGFVNTIP